MRSQRARKGLGGRIVIVVLAITVASFGAFTVVSARHTTPPRVVVYGDSLSVQAAAYIRSDLADHGQIRLSIDAVGGTAPCDRMRTMLHEASADPPRVVVLEFSGNVSCTGAPSGSRAFFRSYATQMTRVARAFASRGTRVFIIGAPIFLGSVLDHNRQWDHLNEIYAGLATRVPDTTFVNAGPSVAPHDQFVWTLPCRPHEPDCERNGSILVRAYDGVHFCEQQAALGSKCLDYSSGAARYAEAMTAPIRAFLAGATVPAYVGQPLPPPDVSPTIAPGQAPDPYLAVHDRVALGHPLLLGESIRSVSGTYQATLRPDGDLVVSGPTGVLWTSRTAGSGAVILTILSDGNAALLSFRGRVHPVWTTHTAGTPANYLGIQDDGRLALYDANVLYWRSS
jgi:hypothetical protein